MTATDPTSTHPATASPAAAAGGAGASRTLSAGPPEDSRKRGLIGALIVWVIALCILGAIGFLAWRYFASQKTSAGAGGGKAQRGVPPVVVEKARRGDMEIYIDRVGTVAAYNTVTIRTRVDGQLDKVAFVEGQLIHDGDLLFQIDPRPYQVQLSQAQAQLAQARAQLAQANGQVVQVQGQLAKDTAQRDNAQRDVDRYNLASEAVAQQIRQTAQATLDSANASLKADNGAIESAKAGIETGDAAIETANAAIDSAKLNIAYCCINSPIDGRIGLRMVDQGNMVHAADTNGMAVVTQLDPISVLFSPNQQDLPRVVQAMAADPHPVVEAWDVADEHLLTTGKLEALDNQIDPTTMTFRIKATFPNANGLLFPNEFVNVRLRVQTLHNALLAPDAAIQQSPTSNFVYVIKPDETVEMRPVTLGPTEGGTTVIEKGVTEGDELVTMGADKLEPGMKVVSHEAEASGAEGGPATAAATGPAGRGAGTGSKATGRRSGAPAGEGMNP